LLDGLDLAENLTTLRRSFGCIVSKSKMSAQSCPFWSR